MSFGDFKGGLQVGLTSITNPVVLVRSGAPTNLYVALRDLVFVIVCEQTTTTATLNVTDNLGNAYTALGAGVIQGTVSVRAYYSVILIGGLLTTISVEATASGDDCVAVAGAFQGPFQASPLDKNPTVITQDLSSPYTCPASGTLTQADEFVACWMCQNDNVFFTATSPNLTNANIQLGVSTTISGAIGFQTVNATTTVSPVWTTTTTPTNDILGTATFMKDLTTPPVQKLVTDLSPRQLPPFPPTYPTDLRTWINQLPITLRVGRLKGAFAVAQGSITDPTNTGTVDYGSGDVAVGDAVVVIVGQQTNLTARGCTDNLGNLYTPVNAGSDNGTATGRAFCSIVQKPGTITNIAVAATASANDVAIVAGIYQGPFSARPAIDSAIARSPANVEDVSTPFICPATGTLSTAGDSHLVIAWGASNPPSTWTAVSPFVVDQQIASSTNINAVLASYVVAPGAGVTPSFTGTSTTDDVLGTFTIMEATALPVGLDVSDIPPRGFPPGSYRANRTWVQAGALLYQPVVQNFMPSVVTSWPIPDEMIPRRGFQIDPEPTNPILAPAAAQPAGQVRAELPVRGPPPLLPVSQGQPIILQPAQAPAGKGATDLPLRAPLPPDRAWTWSYVLSLIGQDKLPFTSREWTTPPRPVIRDFFWSESPVPPTPVAKPFVQSEWLVPLRPIVGDKTWVQRPQPAVPVAAPFVQDDWQLPQRVPTPGRTWTSSYSLTLIGKDTLPFNQKDWPNPKQLFRPDITQIATQALLLPVVQYMPCVVTFMEILTPARADETWIATPSLTPPTPLPSGEQEWAVPQRLAQPDRTWIKTPTLTTPSFPAGEQEWTLVFRGASQPARTWAVTPLPTAAAFPAGEQEWTVPQRPPQFDKTWIETPAVPPAPVFPAGEQEWNLAFRRPAQLDQTWIGQSISGPAVVVRGPIFAARSQRAVEWKPETISQVMPPAPGIPVGEQELILPRGPSYPNQLRAWTWSYNLSLIGKDTIPGEQETTLPRGRIYPTDLRTAISVYYPQLTFTAPLPFNQDDWPNPRGPIYPTDLRTWAWAYQLNLIGQDRLPGRPTDWPPPRGLQQPDRSWIWPLNTPLVVTPATFPAGEVETTLPRGPHPATALRSWSWSYSLTLIGKDKIAGKQETTLPRGQHPATALRSWTWSYALPLIGKDKLPANQKDWPLPRGYIHPNDLRTSISVYYPQLTFTAPLPLSQKDWPNPRGPVYPSDLRTVTVSYKLNLIGKDRLPFIQKDWQLTPAPQRGVQLLTWATRNDSLLGMKFPQPFAQLDWQLPGRYPYPWELLNWVQGFYYGQFAPPPPPPPPQRTPVFTQKYLAVDLPYGSDAVIHAIAPTLPDVMFNAGEPGFFLVSAGGFDISGSAAAHPNDLDLEFLRPDGTILYLRAPDAYIGPITIPTNRGLFLANTWIGGSLPAGSLNQVGIWNIRWRIGMYLGPWSPFNVGPP